MINALPNQRKKGCWHGNPKAMLFGSRGEDTRKMAQSPLWTRIVIGLQLT